MSSALFDLIGRSQPWRDRAACQGLGWEHFIIKSEGNAHKPGLSRAELERIRAAQAVCESCPVRSDCLAFALDLGEYGGVWGGVYLSLRRLRELRKARAPEVAA